MKQGRRLLVVSIAPARSEAELSRSCKSVRRHHRQFPRQAAAPILTCRNRYPCRFRRTPRLQPLCPRPHPHRHAMPVMGAAPIENP